MKLLKLTNENLYGEVKILVEEESRHEVEDGIDYEVTGHVSLYYDGYGSHTYQFNASLRAGVDEDTNEETRDFVMHHITDSCVSIPDHAQEVIAELIDELIQKF